MIRRFFYHAFWNFYDYLGTLTLVGAVYTIFALGIAVFVGLIDFNTFTGQLTGGLLLLFQFLFAVLTLAALLPFCARAARNEPARWPHLKEGLKTRWTAVAMAAGIWLIIMALLIVNFFFYLRIHSQVESPGVQVAMIVVNAAIGWLILVWLFFAPPWLSASTASVEKATLKQNFSKAMMAVALMPRLWIAVLLLLLAATAAGAYTRLGLIFVLPLIASLGQTAYFLCVQYAGFLSAAREELGENQKLGQYKKRARDLAWEWEYRQPRRTFKELIRPWEY